MADERDLKIKLLFESDAKKLEASLRRMTSEFAKLDKRAAALRKELATLKDAGKDTSALEKELSDVNREMDDLLNTARRLDSALQGAGDSAQKMIENFNLRDIGEKLNQIGTGLQNYGRAMLAPLQGSLAAYMQMQQQIADAGGQMSASARQYLEAQRAMQEAYVRIGAVVMDELGPYLDDAVNLVEKIADLVENNPELIKAVAVIGGGLAGAGALVSMVGQLTTIIGTFGALGGAGGAAGGGIAGGLTAAAPYVGTAIAVAFAAELTRRGMNKVLGTDQSWGDIGMTVKRIGALATMGFAEAMNDIGLMSDETAHRLQVNAVAWGTVSEEVENATNRISSAAGQLANAQFSAAWENYQQEMVDASRRYYEQRNQIIEQANKSALQAQQRYADAIAKENASYADNVRRAMEQYRQSELDAERRYAQQRAQTIRDGGKAIRDIEAQHQERLRKMQMDHADRLEGIISNRDALGLAREMRSYQRQRAEEERQTNEQIAKQKRDLADRLQQMAEQYALERQMAAEHYEQQRAEAERQHQQRLADIKARYEEEKKAADERTKERIEALDKQYIEETKRKRQAFLQQIKDLDTTLLDERNRRLYYYNVMLADTDWFMQSWRTRLTGGYSGGGGVVTGTRGGGVQSPVTMMGTGGYADAGLYFLGEQGKEFVLNQQATAAAEQIVGGDLTQANILAALAGRAGAASRRVQASLNMVINVNGAPSGAQFRKIAYDAALEAFGAVLAGV